MLLQGEMPVYTQAEEKLSARSHYVGAALSVIGAIVLLVFAAKTGDVGKILSMLVYGVSLIVLYILSSLYHSTSDQAKRKKMQKCDHASISILVAGSGTAMLGAGLGTMGAYILMGFVWLFAINAFIFNVINVRKFRAVTMASYIAAGWTPMILAVQLFNAMGVASFSLLIAGGAFYLFGLTFYAIHKEYLHAIWHFFVLAGSICHYVAVLLLLI